MRDYTVHFSDGRAILVARLPTFEIEKMLRSSRTVSPASTIAESAARDRLKLELFIRSLGLSAAQGSL